MRVRNCDAGILGEMADARQPTKTAVKRLLLLLRSGANRSEAGMLVGARPTVLKRWMSEDPLLRQEVLDAEEFARGRYGKGKAGESFSGVIREEYLDLIAEGLSVEAAAGKCGLNVAALAHLMRNDAEFAAEVRHAEAEAEEWYLGKMRADIEHAQVGKRWIAALEWLKRRRPMLYGDLQRLEVVQQLEDLKQAREQLIIEGVPVPSLDVMIKDLKIETRKALPKPR